MSLEATLIMLDNSAYSLNGDYLPTRWEAQVDAASLLIQAKLQSNLQSSIGLGLMGGNQVEVLCTMTSDSTKASSFLFGVKVHGHLHFTQALQVGALALKHRSNQTQKPRMVCFIGSKIQEDAQTLKILAKKLKKNNIAVDLICFGDISQQQKQKVETFIKSIQQQENSRSMFIQPGQIYLSDKLLGSKIYNGGSSSNNNGEPAQGGNNVEDDPQLAEAIRLSLLESQNNVVQNQPVSAPSNNSQPTQQQLQKLAIQLSLEQNQNKSEQKKEEKKEEDKKKQE